MICRSERFLDVRLQITALQHNFNPNCEAGPYYLLRYNGNAVERTHLAQFKPRNLLTRKSPNQCLLNTHILIICNQIYRYLLDQYQDNIA